MELFVFLPYIFVIVISAKFSSLSNRMKELDKKPDTLNSKPVELRSNYLKQLNYKSPKEEDTSRYKFFDFNNLASLHRYHYCLWYIQK